MKNRRFLPLALLGLLTLSSCNRGVGCPNNFQLDTDILEQIANIAVLLSNIM